MGEESNDFDFLAGSGAERNASGQNAGGQDDAVRGGSAATHDVMSGATYGAADAAGAADASAAGSWQPAPRFVADDSADYAGSQPLDGAYAVPGRSASPDAETQVLGNVYAGADVPAQNAVSFDSISDQTYTVPRTETSHVATDATATRADAPASTTGAASDGEAAATATRKRRHVWPWILLVLLVLVGIAVGVFVGTTQKYKDRALPGVTVWGVSVQGKTQSEIADQVLKAFDDTTVTVSYNGNSTDVKLADLGYTIDADSIAQQAMDAKRSDSFFSRYASSTKADISPEIGDPAEADPTGIGSTLGVASSPSTDATVVLNDDHSQFVTTAASQGSGLNASSAAQELIDAIKGGNATSPAPVSLQVEDIDPSVTDDIASSAADTLNALIASPITIAGNGGDITTFGADALAACMRVEPDQNADLSSTETRNGYVVFDADKLQDYYDTQIKANYQPTEEDRNVIVNNNGDVLQANSEGHPGVTVADGGDSNVGTDGVKAFANGSGTVTIDATVTPMNTTQTKRHVVIDLSDKKLYAYENDQVIKTFNIADGAGIAADGSCTGDLCTPTGDFTIWWKLDSQDMQGTLTLSNGSTTSWNAPGVKYVNYFSHSGCAIHRISSTYAINDADVPTSGAESHGCVGLGWDVAEWFYNWCLYGTSVHIQQ
ncbi:MAG: L,D-transpeptidase family protein [Pseudoscardovia radai]|nr:L,D-transpeptidase family protein [Pseudoscardovia radai]